MHMAGEVVISIEMLSIKEKVGGKVFKKENHDSVIQIEGQ
jgi:hypothetical protein